jgi:hypothetical protein
MGVEFDSLVRRDILVIWQVYGIDAYSAHGTNLKMLVMLEKGRRHMQGTVQR